MLLTGHMNVSEGFLLIDKPAGITSHGVIARLRRVTGVQRIGHAGTLDPFATGLLVVGVGRGATKRLGEFLGRDKTYEAVAVFGATSDTQDKDGTIAPVTGTQVPGTAAEIAAVIPRFTGEILQTPPMFSAKKIAGKKLYELARAGQEVERQPVTITIRVLETLSYDTTAAGTGSARWTFRVTGSSGTYVRTLAHDIGAMLGCGAYLEALRRTVVGDLNVTEASTLEQITPENWRDLLRQL